jgi:hypothetical protein
MPNRKIQRPGWMRAVPHMADGGTGTYEDDPVESDAEAREYNDEVPDGPGPSGRGQYWRAPIRKAQPQPQSTPAPRPLPPTQFAADGRPAATYRVRRKW